MNGRGTLLALRRLLARAPRYARHLPRKNRRALRTAALELDLVLAVAQELLRKPYEPPAILESVICPEDNPEP